MAGLYNAETVDCGGEQLTLVIDIGAIDLFERKADMGLLTAFNKMGGGDVRLGVMSWMVWAFLRAKHSAKSLGDAADLMVNHSEAVSTALTTLIEGAFPQAAADAEAVGEEKDENPPKRGTGKSS